MKAPRGVLLYRVTCAKCRAASLAAVWLSLGRVRRVPLSSPEGRRLCERHGLSPAKFVLIRELRGEPVSSDGRS